MGKKQKTAAEVVQQITEQGPSNTDPQGSYTGKPMNPAEQPVQDVDDL